MAPVRFRKIMRSWFRKHGRHDLPWRKFPRSLSADRQAYRVLVSEVMLQQTQVARVLTKYPEFVRRFPTIQALARAPLAHVLAVWQGMGYNRRAVCLQQLAERVVHDYRGRIPSDLGALCELPGIGRATAGAVLAFAFNRRAVFIETNIRRVFIHFFFPARRKVKDAAVLAKIEAALPRKNFREWYYALMDYGARALNTIENPNRRSAHYARQTPFAGSRRELRGRILAAVVRQETVATKKLARYLSSPHNRTAFREALDGLAADGLITKRGGRIAVIR